MKNTTTSQGNAFLRSKCSAYLGIVQGGFAASTSSLHTLCKGFLGRETTDMITIGICCTRLTDTSVDGNISAIIACSSFSIMVGVITTCLGKGPGWQRFCSIVDRCIRHLLQGRSGRGRGGTVVVTVEVVTSINVCVEDTSLACFPHSASFAITVIHFFSL